MKQKSYCLYFRFVGESEFRYEFFSGLADLSEWIRCKPNIVVSKIVED